MEQELVSTTGQPAPPQQLEMPADLHAAMISHVRAALPWEGCGLIGCLGNRAVKLYPGTNIERSATRFNMDPAEIVAALDDIERHGWQLGAIFHSHPQSAARPSPTDLAFAYYPESLMVVISLADSTPDVRAFRVDGPVREVPVVVLPAAGFGEGERGA